MIYGAREMLKDKLKELIELNETIGRNIRRERLKMKITQDQMADLVHLTSGYISLIERGERGLTISNLRSFADVFGISIKRLFDGEFNEAGSDNNRLSDRDEKIELIERQVNLMDEHELEFLFSIITEVRTLKRASDLCPHKHSQI